MANKNKAERKKSQFSGHILHFIFKWTVTLGIWGLVIIGSITAFFAYDLPSTDKALEVSRRPAVTLLAQDGSKIADLGDFQGLAIHVKDLPKQLLQAVIATEDRRFYSHFGVDIIGVARAIIRNIKAGRVVQGGSTISQQAAKNLFLTPERTFKRKYQELILTLWLEHRFSKDQILSIYLNRVYLGSGTYGVDAAARKYFGVSARKLNIFQSAIIAGLLKAPSRLNPLTNAKGAVARGKLVLLNMVEAGYLSKIQALRAKNSKIIYMKTHHTLGVGRYFSDWVLGLVRGFVGPDSGDITVKTTLNARLQGQAETHIENYLSKNSKKYNVHQGAVVVMSPAGAVLAMVGGRNYKTSQFNRSTQARRQPGSAFKPIVYLAGIESGLTSETKFIDSRTSVKGWTPKNYDGKYNGEMSLKQALARSINTIAVKVWEHAGRDNVIKTAKRLGITAPLTPSPSLALGTSGISLMELTGAYAVFANGGQSIWPFGVVEIRNKRGKVIYRRQGNGAGQIIEPRHVRAMDIMLAEVIQSGTGKKAMLRRQAYGKTGTSQSFRDAWFVGYTRKTVAGVWVGNDDDAPMKKVTGGGLPAIIWQKIMSDINFEDQPPKTLRSVNIKKQVREKSFLDKIFGSILDLD